MGEEKLAIGGQAVIEGVMMRSPNFYSVAVRQPNKKISVKSEKIDSFFSRHKIFKKLFIRGIAQLIEMLIIGIKTLTYSANESAGEKNEEKLSFWEIFFTLAFAFGFAALLFILLPLFVSKLLTSSNGFIFNLIDGVLRILVFFIYLAAISQMKDVKRIFEYHGAEHKTVHCYEKKLPLTVKNVKKYSTLHPRCGTSFIMIVLIISILVFSLVTANSFWMKFLSRIILIPIIAGISYEFLKLFAKYEHKPLIRFLLYPGMLVQKLTTKEPDNKQIEVAIVAAKKVLSLEKA
jgi:uncharacterized protein YqhQ